MSDPIIPAPLPEDFEIDAERFYRSLSGELGLYDLAEPAPSSRAFIRRAVAAEAEVERLRAEIERLKREGVRQ